MARRLRRLAFLLVPVLLAGLAALVATSRSHLTDRRDAVDREWEPLRAPLSTRYEHLSEATAAAVESGGEREILTELTDTLERWQRLQRSEDRRPGTEVVVANELEGLARRLRATTDASPRLSADEALLASLTAFETAAPPEDLVEAYNDAVLGYEESRTSLPRRWVAGLLGFGSRPALVPPSPAPS
ncbi:MAG: hypothetical protein M5U14_01290 [Acidimicrobiia bacterium]|nr:hypothetical protein [Acidimicrobiia bacterium]